MKSLRDTICFNTTMSFGHQVGGRYITMREGVETKAVRYITNHPPEYWVGVYRICERIKRDLRIESR